MQNLKDDRRLEELYIEYKHGHISRQKFKSKRGQIMAEIKREQGKARTIKKRV